MRAEWATEGPVFRNPASNFGGWLRDTTDELSVPENVGVNINIDGSEGQMPDVDAPEPEAPAPDPDGNQG